MITREEYELLKNYRDIGYKWIARDKDGELYVYEIKPTKLNRYWLSFNIGDGTEDICDDNHLLQCIKWGDEKPTKINDLIHDYDSYLVITEEKNMNKAELIKEIEDILDDIGVSDYQLGECDEDTIWTISSITFREILSAIEKHSPVSVGENVKVTIPQFVADWIEEVKGLKRRFKLEHLCDTLRMPKKVYDWLDEQECTTDILARAWLDGYVVEKEKLYTVRLANGDFLCRFKSVGIDWAKGQDYRNDKDFQLTQSEIESVDPRLMEFVEEVE